MSNEHEIDMLREKYESPEIPASLKEVVQDARIRAEEERKEVAGGAEKRTNRGTRKAPWKKLIATAAAIALFFVAFGVGVNKNEAFADSLSGIPILGSLVKVFTAQEVKKLEDSVVIDMKIPGIEGLKDKALQDKINKEVYEKFNLAVEESKKQILEDKKIWLETGGNEEDYTPMEIQVDYEVKALTPDTLSFLVWKTQTNASAYFEIAYYNYDLVKSKELTLQDLLGPDYISIANQQIAAEIAERSKDENNTYWDGSNNIEGFTTIASDQNFYVNEKGNAVIVFNKYEIAPGYMGMQEFEILR